MFSQASWRQFNKMFSCFRSNCDQVYVEYVLVIRKKRGSCVGHSCNLLFNFVYNINKKFLTYMYTSNCVVYNLHYIYNKITVMLRRGLWWHLCTLLKICSNQQEREREGWMAFSDQIIFFTWEDNGYFNILLR